MTTPAAVGGVGRRVRRQAPGTRQVVVETTLVSLGAGLLVGLLWLLVAPQVAVEVVAGEPSLAGPIGESQFGADAWFAIIAAVAGMLIAAVLFTRHRHRPLAALGAFVAGGVMGSLVAWNLGVLLGPDPIDVPLDDAADGTRLTLPLDLGATGVLLVWPIAGVVAVMVLCLFGNDPSPWRTGPPREPDVSRADRSVPWSPL